MKYKRKITVAIVMAALMVFSLIPGCAFADEGNMTHDGLTFKVMDENGLPYAVVTGYESIPEDGVVEIPASLEWNGNPVPVTTIGESAFVDAEALTSVKIPDTITEIRNRAFMSTGLKEIEIPASVVTIGAYKPFGFRETIKDPESFFPVIEFIPVEGFVIHGVTGSAAQTYATENNISFAPVIFDISRAFQGVELDAQIYTGKALQPVPAISPDSDIVEGRDYTIEYQNNVAVGTACMTITGMGNYAGTIDLPFAINPKSTSIKKLSRGKTTLTVKWYKKTLKMNQSRITGYEVELSRTPSFDQEDLRHFKVKG
ncbi:MAG: leucine-rich repeat domain-containing protein, partial [Bacillota bacterium]|nr:leucine-rich repeat domain-containing protein [Bacillota bacterium]